MMLQGHFIDCLMHPSAHDSSNLVYQVWKYFRGITAPTFFSISGLIFSYLLLQSKHTGKVNLRIKKGIYRGLMLIAIGYALRIPIFDWVVGVFPMRFLKVDVLQIIGLSLIFMAVTYVISFKKSLVYSMLMLLLGVLIFITEPWYRELSVDGMPVFLANYLTTIHGSVFTVLPWLGYVCIGSFIASIFYGYVHKERFKPILIAGMSIVGMLLIYHSSTFFMQCYRWTDILLFKQVAYYNYLFTRLGNVLVLFSVFYAAETFLKKSIILKIGQKTLSIYVIHFIIIYGSFTGYGLHQFLGKSLSPVMAIIGAIMFVVSVCVIALYGVQSNKFIYHKVRSSLLRQPE